MKRRVEEKKGVDGLYKDRLDRVLEKLRDGTFFDSSGVACGMPQNPFRVNAICVPGEASYDDIGVCRNEGGAGLMHGEYEWSDYIRSVAEGYFYHQEKIGKKAEANSKIDFYLKRGAAEEVMDLAVSQEGFCGSQTLIDEFAENLEIAIMNRFLWGDEGMDAASEQFDSIVSQGFGLVGFAGIYPQSSTLLISKILHPPNQGDII